MGDGSPIDPAVITDAVNIMVCIQPLTRNLLASIFYFMAN